MIENSEEVINFDEHHFTSLGSEYIVEKIKEKMIYNKNAIK